MQGKAIIVSAPSGAGKTTIVKHLLSVFPYLAFSVSACSRPMREKEQDGTDYFFLTKEQFKEKIDSHQFVEWQEVFPGSYYGTLKSEIERIWDEGKTPIFDVDVLGGINLKKYFGENALAIFIRPPSAQVLEDRLRKRGTENEESIRTRIKKGEKEMTFAPKFDKVIVNDEIIQANSQASCLIRGFLCNDQQ